MPKMQGNRSPSLCTQAGDAERAVHWASVSNQTVRAEMVDEIYRSASTRKRSNAARDRQDRVHLIGEVRARLLSAARGRLPVGEPDQFEPVRRNPDLWEHKWKKTAFGEFRLYHAEPDVGPDVVLLVFHRKEVEPRDGKTIEELQEEQMDKAAARNEEGRNGVWGHARTRCTDCETA